MAGILQTVKCWSMQCDLILHVKSVVLLRIHSQLQAYGTHVMPQKWCSAFTNGRTYGDDQQWLNAHSCLTADNTASFTDALVVRDRYITLESSFLLDSVHSIAHDNLDYRKKCVWMLGGKEPWSLRAHKNGTHCCGFDTWHSCKESPFCSEMWLVAWNPKPKNIHVVRRHIILLSKELQQCHQYEESWQLSPETIRVCFLWICLTVEI